MNQFLRKFLRTRLAGQLTGLIFSKASNLVPLKRLKETPSWMAVLHPDPGYPVHIVILPKHKIANWMTLPIDDPSLYTEFVVLTQTMIHEFCLEDAGYRLIVNGGRFQTFPHLHVHLVAGEALNGQESNPPKEQS
jgi:histidine triad (HIT) family protein